ncbi:MAG: glycosyltransferase [Gammaproteobacteria bacterium]|nr:glycosyltransferase [Gammaproteobacteria bacterium]
MKVLHVVHGLPRGGLETGVVNVVNGLPGEGFRQEVCCLDQRGVMAERLRPDVPVHVLHRGRHDLRVPFKLGRLIRQVRPDVVHCRNWNAWLDTLLGCRIAGFDGQLVWSFHGFADGHHFPRRRRLASRALAAVTDHLLAVCRDSAERYAHLTGIDPARFQVVYNGVDTSRFHPREAVSALRGELGLPANTVLVTTVGSLTPVKNHLGLIEAAARHCAQSGVTATFLIVGDGALRETLRARIEALGLSDRVLLHGPSDRIPEVLAASDVFVLPSHLEGMSNAILEAMASGLPVVAFRTGGNPELVDHGHTGLLCEPGDNQALAAAISQLVEQAELRSALGSQARERASKVFSIAQMTAGYEAYYRRIAAVPGEMAVDGG